MRIVNCTTVNRLCKSYYFFENSTFKTKWKTRKLQYIINKYTNWDIKAAAHSFKINGFLNYKYLPGEDRKWDILHEDHKKIQGYMK